jgi:hypothetical protein
MSRQIAWVTLQCIVAALLTLQTCQAVEFQTSATVGPDNAILGDSLIATDGPMPPTVITLIEGGVIGGEDSVVSPSVMLNGQSELHMLGGQIENGATTSIGIVMGDTSKALISGGRIEGESTGISANDNALIEVTGGTINGDNQGSIQLSESSHLMIRGGFVRGTIFSAGSTTSEIRGGRLVGDGAAIQLNDAAMATISGGEFIQNPSGPSGPILLTDGESSLNILGGSFPVGIRAAGMSTINLYGGAFMAIPGQSSFQVFDEAVINIYGLNLSIENNVLTGSLADETNLNHVVETQGNGRLVLHQIPEPAFRTLSIWILLLVFGWPCRPR